MKNWKRRFFVLTEISLGYYKTIEVGIVWKLRIGWGEEIFMQSMYTYHS